MREGNKGSLIPARSKFKLLNPGNTISSKQYGVMLSEVIISGLWMVMTYLTSKYKSIVFTITSLLSAVKRLTSAFFIESVAHVFSTVSLKIEIKYCRNNCRTTEVRAKQH